ncbi:MAG: hypothetical protein IPM72_01375 [Chitinophagaceae bacterium]|nr:hypothetical protein [Chitinophagaceae bacterium]
MDGEAAIIITATNIFSKKTHRGLSNTSYDNYPAKFYGDWEIRKPANARLGSKPYFKKNACAYPNTNYRSYNISRYVEVRGLFKPTGI